MNWPNHGVDCAARTIQGRRPGRAVVSGRLWNDDESGDDPYSTAVPDSEAKR